MYNEIIGLLLNIQRGFGRYCDFFGTRQHLNMWCHRSEVTALTVLARINTPTTCRTPAWLKESELSSKHLSQYFSRIQFFFMFVDVFSTPKVRSAATNSHATHPAETLFVGYLFFTTHAFTINVCKIISAYSIHSILFLPERLKEPDIPSTCTSSIRLIHH